MAHHLSAKKRIRQSKKRQQHNSYYHVTTRNSIKKLRETTDKEQAITLLPKVSGMLDKLAKRNIIHKNKASNIKSKLTRYVNSIS